MIWIAIGLSGLAVFAIAAGTVGTVSAALATRPRRVVYDIEAAIDHIATVLPDEVTAVVSFDDVRAVIEWRLAFLSDIGLASAKVDDSGSEELVVVGDDEALAYVLAQSDSEDLGLTDEQVAAIFLADDDYQRSIGAIRA